MFQRLFNITLLVVVAIVSIVFIAFLLAGLISMVNPPLLSGSSGISAVAGGVSEKSLRLVYLVLLLAAVIYLWRRHRSR
ncbi:MAG TPA: hypothetical protein VFO72_10380 [Pyrinomonadaceae bacterium]|nr:hypothetical protein [Pyrinomonadaceae bacterium]